MPIYEYKCMECNSEFECLVIGSKDEVTCPDCQGDKVERMMSACSFKSSGNYSSSASSSGCSGCTGGSCATCH